MALVESKKGGPYSKPQREKRRNEVFRLHFELGYSAKKISEMMNVNRNTINSDIEHGRSQLITEWGNTSLGGMFMKQLYRFENQRRSLLDELKKSQELKDKLAIQKIVLEIDTKILHFFQKLAGSEETLTNAIIDAANDLVNNHKWNQSGFINMRDVRKTLAETRDKINKLIDEDAKKQVGKIGF